MSIKKSRLCFVFYFFNCMVTLYYELLIKSFVLNVRDLTIKLDTIHNHSIYQQYLSLKYSKNNIYLI